MTRNRFLFGLTTMVAMAFGVQQQSFAADYSSSSSSSSSSCSEHVPGQWQLIANQPYNIFGPPDTYPAAYNPLLMTSGEIFVLNLNGPPYTGEAWKLTPDIYGSYENGTWTQLASLPEGYAPLYFAGAVLKDGRIIVLGGEYNGPNYDFAMTDQGAIYDPVTDSWEQITAPSYFARYNGEPGAVFGDGPSVVLEDGSFLVGNPTSKQAAILDPETLTWTEVDQSTRRRTFTETGMTLLPNGKVFVKDSFGDPYITGGLFKTEPFPLSGLAEIYNPKTGKWSSAGYSPVDTQLYGFEERGASMLRPDGTVITVGSRPDISVYDAYSGKWKKEGARFPAYEDAQNVPTLTVTSPKSLLGDRSSKTFSHLLLGSQPVSQAPFSVTGPIKIAYPRTAIPSVDNDLTGAFALIDANLFEDGGSLTKCNNAADAGAIGCILYDSSGYDWGAGAISGSSVIPSVYIDTITGQKLLDNLNDLEATLESKLGPLEIGGIDAPAVLLPNGNCLLFAAPSRDSSGHIFLAPTQVFELDMKNTLFQESTVNSPDIPCYAITATLLPTGQVLTCNMYYPEVEIYTPGDRSYNKEWAPVIRDCPHKIKAGKTYKIKGYLFNGMSEAVKVDDENNSATNYPLVRLTFEETGHVFYCRTHDHSYMGVANRDKKVHTYFDVPTTWAGYPMETGKAKLEVVANGIPSKPVTVHVTW